MTSFQNSSFQNKGYLIINKNPQYFRIRISHLIFVFLRTKLQTINRFIHLYIYLILSYLEHFTSHILYFVLSVKVLFLGNACVTHTMIPTVIAIALNSLLPGPDRSFADNTVDYCAEAIIVVVVIVFEVAYS